jgi:hypothetical protein
MRALHIHAGPQAMAHVRAQGLAPADVAVIPGAAGGPKGLILGPLDRFLFGQWLPQSAHRIDLVGASIGAWRLAAACLHNPAEALRRLERDYIAQHYELPPGQKRPSAEQVSREFGNSLRQFYGGRVDEVLRHPRYRLHVITSRGKHLLAREARWRTPMGYAGAFFANVARRRAMGAWLERVVFSTPQADGRPAVLPFSTVDYPTRQVDLSAANFMQAVQASCSIPFVLQAVHDIPGAPSGAYWDGGITDYHLHLHYQTAQKEDKLDPDLIAARGQPSIQNSLNSSGIVLYPHFQQAVVPGWLDKSLKWRHKATPALSNMLLLAPNPEWVKSLPNGKLPNRDDFVHYGPDLAGRMKAWNTAVAASQQLADEFAAWLERPDPAQVAPL